MKPTLVRCILLSAVLCAACRDGPESGEEAPGDDQPTDLFAPEGESLRLAKEPILVVGLDESLPLDRVRGAVFFGDGIAIANSGSSEILIVDSAGRLVSRRGGKGDGPGEYRYLDSFARHKDGLIAFDGWHLRLTVLDSSGEYVSGTKISPPAWVNTSIVGAFGNSALFQFVARGFRGEGDVGPLEARPEVGFAIVRLADGVVTFESTRPGEEQWGQRRGRTHGGLPVIFGRRAVSAVTDRRAYLATTDSLTLTEYDETGNGLDISFRQPRVNVEEGWERFARDTMRARIEAWPPGTVRDGDGRLLSEVFKEIDLSLLKDLPARPTLPGFSAIKGASDGRLWIREYPKPMQDQVAWIAFSEAWVREERVEMPTTLRVLDFSDDRVLVLSKGEFGEDVVEVYSIER